MRMHVLQIRRLIDNLMFKETPIDSPMENLTETNARLQAAKNSSEKKKNRDKEHSCLLFSTILDNLENYKFTKVAIKHVDGVNNKADALTKPLDVFPIFKDQILHHVSCVRNSN